MFFCTVNVSSFRICPSINQPLPPLAFLFRTLVEASFTKVSRELHSKESQGLFSEGHGDASGRYFLHLPDALEKRNERSNRTTGRNEKVRKRRISRRATAYTLSRSREDITDSPHQYHFGTARHAHLSLTLASLSTPRPRRLCPLRNPIRCTGTLRLKSDSRRVARPEQRITPKRRADLPAIYPRDFTD